MKKFILPLIALIAMVGCAKVEEGKFATPSDNKIFFEAPIVAPATKAIISGETYPTDESFKVWSVWTSEDYGADNLWSDATLYINGGTVSYEAAKNGWAGNYYWPKNGKLTFQAVSPSSVSATVAADGAISITNYTIAGGVNQVAAAAQVDVLYSDIVANQTKADEQEDNPDYYGIQIGFAHALSQLAFTAKTNADYSGSAIIEINSIKIKEIGNKSTFTRALSATTGMGEDAAWSAIAADDITSYTIFDGSTTAQTITSTEAAIGNNLLVIPQTFTAINPDNNSNAFIEIEYSIIGTGDIAGDDPVTQIVTQKLSDLEANDAALAFEMGKKYIFNLIIGLDKIYFAPQVTDWTDVTVTDGTTSDGIFF